MCLGNPPAGGVYSVMTTLRQGFRRVRLCLLVTALLSAVRLAASGQEASEPLGFEGETGRTPSGWTVRTPGWNAELTDAKFVVGKTSMRLSKTGPPDAPFGNLLRALDATRYQGRHVKLTAKVLVEGDGGSCQMWLRADRPGRLRGAFDNMAGRGITPGGWKEAVIEADIDADAVALTVGFMALGRATVYVDSVSVEAGDRAAAQEASPPRALTARGLENVVAAARLLSYVRFFHPSDQAVALKNWDHFAPHLIEQAERAADARELAERLNETFKPLAPTLSVWAGGDQRAPALPPLPEATLGLAHWRHLGAGNIGSKVPMNVYSSEVVRDASVDKADEAYAKCFLIRPLGGGVTCRLPVNVPYDARGTLPFAEASEWSTQGNRPRLSSNSRSVRLAGVALCWGVMQHFYPYFEEAKLSQDDWDGALVEALSKAATDADDVAYLDTLRGLVAKLNDGHANVWNPAVSATSMLPLTLAWAGADLVVAGKHESVPAEVTVGDVVVSIDGKSVEATYRELSGRISAATDGWRRHTSLSAFVYRLTTADPAGLLLRRSDGSTYAVKLSRVPPGPVADVTAKRPANGTELADGIVYFNLDRTDATKLKQAMPTLEKARGIVFDLRGYPDSAAYELLPHQTDKEITSARWRIPVVALPDRQGWTWNEPARWSIRPKAPRLDVPIAFLTDGRAISYAESVLGIVEAYKLGEIVGAPTAGTNGNINPFTLPGGYSVNWTGMNVRKHDGSPHHGVGIHPTLRISPTAEGIRQGKDEVLDAAVRVLQQKVATQQEK